LGEIASAIVIIITTYIQPMPTMSSTGLTRCPTDEDHVNPLRIFAK
jgi:hypothetical protein